MTALAWTVFALALLPLAMTLWNLLLYRPPRASAPPGTVVSVLIPARDEAANIGPAIAAVLANRDVELELVVLDDHSTDGTAAIVLAAAARDPRLRLERAPPLPSGWSGKQHACWVLANHARHDVLLFLDADVRVAPGAVSRAAGFLLAGRSGLVSGFPREVTATAAEHLTIPWIHLLLLGYLPMGFMRLFKAHGFGAGCGQFMVARRHAYMAAGGHAAIRTSLHDGVTLPRAFRRAGFMTDLFDATDLATCRMYAGWDQVWSGFGKNATEGMATPAGLPVWTILIGGGHVLPLPVLLTALAVGPAPATMLAGAALLCNMAQRALVAVRFRQNGLGIALHPAGAALLLAIQWMALVRAWRRRPAMWRGRSYPGVSG